MLLQHATKDTAYEDTSRRNPSKGKWLDPIRLEKYGASIHREYCLLALCAPERGPL